MKMIRSGLGSIYDTRNLISWLYPPFNSELLTQLRPVPKNAIDFI